MVIKYLLKILQCFFKFSHGKMCCTSPIITLWLCKIFRKIWEKFQKQIVHKNIKDGKHAFEYLGSISIAFDASSIALPYSSSLVWANARFAQYTAFWPFSSIAWVYKSIAWEYLWAERKLTELAKLACSRIEETARQLLFIRTFLETC